jgi:NAD(P)-dependent dehydrogenase (short-subunit alcohol dehydrogenase family)
LEPGTDARLDGKVAVVTGAGRGIGAASAAELARAGASVVLAARSRAELEKVREALPGGAGSLVVPTDVSKTEDLDRLIAAAVGEFGGVDVLLNNAGVMPPAKQIYNVGVDEWEHVMAVNVRAPWYLGNLVHEHMKKRGGGVVINVSSTSGLHHDIGLGVYSVSKAAVVMLTQVQAKEWARDRIRVNALAPGVVRTKLAGGLLKYLEDHEAKPNPMNIVGEPQDIARLVRYLATDESRYMTGSVIRIDGGELL